jgi:hypothetical protein
MLLLRFLSALYHHAAPVAAVPGGCIICLFYFFKIAVFFPAHLIAFGAAAVHKLIR